MGFFDKYLKKKRTDLSTEKPEYDSTWAVYETELQGMSAAIAVDLGCEEISGLDRQPELGTIVLKFDKALPPPTSLDMARGEESRRLNKVLSEKLGATFAGSITYQDTRVLYFYTGHGQDFKQTVKEVMEESPVVTYEVNVIPDPDWKTYSEALYPSPEHMLAVRNRQYYRFLEKEGIILPEEAPIHHYFKFSGRFQRDEFFEKVRDREFKIIRDVPAEDEHDLEIIRTESLSIECMNALSLRMHTLALEYGGTYLGWDVDEEELEKA